MGILKPVQSVYPNTSFESTAAAITAIEESSKGSVKAVIATIEAATVVDFDSEGSSESAETEREIETIVVAMTEEAIPKKGHNHLMAIVTETIEDSVVIVGFTEATVDSEDSAVAIVAKGLITEEIIKDFVKAISFAAIAEDSEIGVTAENSITTEVV